MPVPVIDLIGQRFDRLLVKKRVHRKPKMFWECLCDCGNITIVVSASLRYGITKSCGCYHKEYRVTNGQQIAGRVTPEYRAFHKAKERCQNPKTKGYSYYGGRGVKFLFESFEQFFKEVGPRPKGLTLDRKNPNGNYEPGNVRWADWHTQRVNQRRTLCV
jgi:hypothetical protein